MIHYQVQCNECHKIDAESLSRKANYRKLHEGGSSSILTIKWEMGWDSEEMFLDKRIIIKARLLRFKMKNIFGKSGINHFCLVYRILIG